MSSATSFTAKIGLTSQSKLPVRRALAVPLVTRPVSDAIALNKTLPRLKQPNAPIVRCPSPPASTLTQRKVSPPAVVVRTARQAEAIAKHLKRFQPAAKAHPVAVQQRLKPSQQPPISVKNTLPSASLSIRKAPTSALTLKVAKRTDDQVLEALSSSRVSSLESAASTIPGSRMSSRRAAPRRNPTTRPVLRSCLAKKNVVPAQISPECRSVKRVNFGTSSTSTVPKVRVYETTLATVTCRYPSRLKQISTENNAWERMDDPEEVPKQPGSMIVDECGYDKKVKVYHNCACQLRSYCTGYCRDRAARGGFEMPVNHAYRRQPSTIALLRCSLCLEQRSAKDKGWLEDGSYVVVGTVDDRKASKSVGTSTILEKSGICECSVDNFAATPVDKPYDFDSDPDIF